MHSQHYSSSAFQHSPPISVFLNKSKLRSYGYCYAAKFLGSIVTSVPQWGTEEDVAARFRAASQPSLSKQQEDFYSSIFVSVVGLAVVVVSQTQLLGSMSSAK